MIRKLTRQMLTAQIFAALTVSLCLMIDSVMISRFLGEEAIAAIHQLTLNGKVLLCAQRKGRSDVGTL